MHNDPTSQAPSPVPAAVLAAIPAAVTTAADARSLGRLVAVAHEPSNTTGSRTHRLPLGDMIGGIVSATVGTGLVVLGVIARGSAGAHMVAIAAGALAVLFGRHLIRDGYRERSWDVYHFQRGLVRWHAKKDVVIADRWYDFTRIHDRVDIPRRHGVTTSADYRATLTRPDGTRVILSTSTANPRRLHWESAKLKALVAAARLGSGPHGTIFQQEDHFGLGAELIDAFRTYAPDYDDLPPASAALVNWVPFPAPYDRIIFSADGEDLAEGFVEPWLASMAPALAHYGLLLTVATTETPHRFDTDGRQSDYVLTINGVRCVVWEGAEWDDDDTWDPWTAATLRPLELLNRLLDASAASPVRAHVVSAGWNDGFVVLVDPQVLTLMRERGWAPEDTPVLVQG